MKFHCEGNPHFDRLLLGKSFSEFDRHNKTQIVIKDAIAASVHKFASKGSDLLEVGGHTGLQTMFYRDQFESPSRTALYDWKNFIHEDLQSEIEFHQVDLEAEGFPDPPESFDVVVCNQVFEHLKNIFKPISEIWRVLRPGGHLILSVPNLSALHNCALLPFGKQPTTINIKGSHVRGYAIHSMTKFLLEGGHFSLAHRWGIAMHPISHARLPGFLSTWCHTPIWVLKKNKSGQPLWDEQRDAEYTTTNF